jgi:plasmid stabilization system protein ParE
MKFDTLIYSDEAEENYDNIFDYIAQDNPTKAVEFTDELKKRVNKLKDFPTLGKERPQNRTPNKNKRRLIFKDYKIYYTIDNENKRINIDFIRHGAMKEKE